MSHWQFDTETQITEQGPGRWSTRLATAWNIGDNPNGGYVAIPGLRAMAGLADQADPVSVTIHYLRPGLGGEPGEVHAEVVRPGRAVTTTEATLYQGGKERLRMLAAFSELDRGAESPKLTIPPADIPSPDACRSRTTLIQGVDVALTSRLDVRIAPPVAASEAVDQAEVAGWVRFADGRPPDTTALVLFADAFPPSVFSRFGRVGWVPTIELTVQVRRRPVPGWIAARFRTLDLADGRLVEDGELWDEAGNLVARSRQLALLMT